MPRKNIKDYTQMQIKKTTLRNLGKLRIHPRQSYTEVIDDLIKNVRGKHETH